MVSTLGLPEQQCREISNQVCLQARVDLEDFTITKAGRREIVRVVVDQDGGIDLDLIADISRLISEKFDSKFESMDVPYVLEVSSPGVDRPLTQMRHWRRAIGHLVKIELKAANDPRIYRVADVEGEAVTLTNSNGEVEMIPVSEISSAVVQVEFNRGD